MARRRTNRRGGNPNLEYALREICLDRNDPSHGLVLELAAADPELVDELLELLRELLEDEAAGS